MYRLHCEDDGRATARLDLIAQLKTEYSCQALPTGGKKGRPSEEERGGKVSDIVESIPSVIHA